jgi:hypothetical protein
MVNSDEIEGFSLVIAVTEQERSARGIYYTGLGIDVYFGGVPRQAKLSFTLERKSHIDDDDYRVNDDGDLTS